VLRSSTRSDFVEGESDLGEAISGLFKILGILGIKTDVGFCVASIDFCQTILENYPHAAEGDGVLGAKKKRRCGTCKKARIDAYCKICEGERICKTCEEQVSLISTLLFYCKFPLTVSEHQSGRANLPLQGMRTRFMGWSYLAILLRVWPRSLYTVGVVSILGSKTTC